MPRRGLSCGFGVALLVALTSLSARAQEDGGLVVELTFSEQLRYEDDDGADDLFARTDLGFRVFSETRNQVLSFEARAGLEKFRDTSGINLTDTDFQDPFALLLYARESRMTSLEFSAGYRRRDVRDLAATDDIATDPLTTIRGDREDIFTDLSLEFGRENPVGALVFLSYRERSFIDEFPPNSEPDSYETRAELRLRVDLSETTSGFLIYEYDDLDRVGGTDVRTDRIGAGLQFDISEAVRGAIDIGYSEVVEDGAVPRSVDEGVFVRGLLETDRPNGTLALLLDSDITENGRTSTLRVDRALGLPRGSLSFGVGVGLDDVSDEPRGLYSLNYFQEFPRGSFNAGFEQSYATDSNSNESLESRLSLGGRLELGPLSDVTAGFVYRNSDQLSGTGQDIDQFNMSLAYNHRLTERWTLFGGIERIVRERSPGPDDTDDRVFLGLRTSILWRP